MSDTLSKVRRVLIDVFNETHALPPTASHRPIQERAETAIMAIIEAARAEGLRSPSGGGAWVLQRNDRPYQVFFDEAQAKAVCAGKREEDRRWREENRHVADVRVFWNVYKADQPCANVTPPPPTGEVGGVEPVAWRVRCGLNHPLVEGVPFGWQLSEKRPEIGEGAKPEWFDIEPLFAAPPSREAQND